MTKLEQEREAIKKKPKNFANLIALMKAHASMLEVYEYVEAFQKELEFEQVILQSQLDHAIDEQKHAFYDGQLRTIDKILEGDGKNP